MRVVPRQDHIHARTAGVRYEWRETIEEVFELAPMWRELESRVRDRMVFGSFDHMLAWYSHHQEIHGRPLVGAAWRGDDLIGLAPFAFREASLGRVPVRRVESAGHDGDAGEILFPEAERYALEGLLGSLFTLGRFDVAVLCGIAPDSWRHGALQTSAARLGLGLEEVPYQYAVLDLEEGFEQYESRLNAKLRGNLRRRRKRAEELGGVALDRIHHRVDTATLDAYLERLFLLYKRSWKAQGQEPLREHHRRFYSDAAARFNERGMLEIAFLKIGDRDASFIMGLREGDVWYDVTISYDEEFASVSPGTLLILDVARQVSREGVRRIVSHGDREYKRYWATGWIPQRRVLVFRPGIRAGLARAARFQVPRLLARFRGGEAVGPAAPQPSQTTTADPA